MPKRVVEKKKKKTKDEIIPFYVCLPAEGKLGLQIHQPVVEVEEKGLFKEELTICKVEKNSPAAGKLLGGDVITHLNSDDVSEFNCKDFAQKAGEKTNVRFFTVQRKCQKIWRKLPDWGEKHDAFRDAKSKQIRIQGKLGVTLSRCAKGPFHLFVQAVTSLSPLAGKVSVGDIITHLNGVCLYGVNAEEFKQILTHIIKKNTSRHFNVLTVVRLSLDDEFDFVGKRVKSWAQAVVTSTLRSKSQKKASKKRKIDSPAAEIIDLTGSPKSTSSPDTNMFQLMTVGAKAGESQTTKRRKVDGQNASQLKLQTTTPKTPKGRTAKANAKTVSSMRKIQFRKPPKLGLLLIKNKKLNGFVVNKVLTKSPLKGKVFKGEVITHINGQSLNELKIMEVSTLIKKQSVDCEIEFTLAKVTNNKDKVKRNASNVIEEKGPEASTSPKNPSNSQNVASGTSKTGDGRNSNLEQKRPSGKTASPNPNVPTRAEKDNYNPSDVMIEKELDPSSSSSKTPRNAQNVASGARKTGDGSNSILEQNVPSSKTTSPNTNAQKSATRTCVNDPKPKEPIVKMTPKIANDSVTHRVEFTTNNNSSRNSCGPDKESYSSARKEIIPKAKEPIVEKTTQPAKQSVPSNASLPAVKKTPPSSSKTSVARASVNDPKPKEPIVKMTPKIANDSVTPRVEFTTNNNSSRNPRNSCGPDKVGKEIIPKAKEPIVEKTTQPAKQSVPSNASPPAVKKTPLSSSKSSVNTVDTRQNSSPPKEVSTAKLKGWAFPTVDINPQTNDEWMASKVAAVMRASESPRFPTHAKNSNGNPATTSSGQSERIQMKNNNHRAIVDTSRADADGPPKHSRPRDANKADEITIEKDLEQPTKESNTEHHMDAQMTNLPIAPRPAAQQLLPHPAVQQFPQHELSSSLFSAPVSEQFHNTAYANLTYAMYQNARAMQPPFPNVPMRPLHHQHQPQVAPQFQYPNEQLPGSMFGNSMPSHQSAGINHQMFSFYSRYMSNNQLLQMMRSGGMNQPMPQMQGSRTSNTKSSFPSIHQTRQNQSNATVPASLVPNEMRDVRPKTTIAPAHSSLRESNDCKGDNRPNLEGASRTSASDTKNNCTDVQHPSNNRSSGEESMDSTGNNLLHPPIGVNSNASRDPVPKPSNSIIKQENKKIKKRPLHRLGEEREVTLARTDTSLGIAIRSARDLGGILVLSVTSGSRMCGKLFAGDLITHFNQKSLKDRSGFEFLVLFQNYKSLKKITVRRVIGIELEGYNTSTDNAPEFPSSHAQPQEITLKPGLIEFECRYIHSCDKMIVYNIDLETERLTGIQRGDAVLEFDGLCMASLAMKRLKQILITTTQKERKIKIRKSTENNRRNTEAKARLARPATPTWPQQKSQSKSKPVPSRNGTTFPEDRSPHSVVLEPLSSACLPKEELDVLPVSYAYIVGNKASESAAQLLTHHANKKLLN